MVTAAMPDAIGLGLGFGLTSNTKRHRWWQHVAKLTAQVAIPLATLTAPMPADGTGGESGKTLMLKGANDQRRRFCSGR